MVQLSTASRLRNKFAALKARYSSTIAKRQKLKCDVPIQTARNIDSTVVEDYWEKHTVNSVPFFSEQESIDYLAWRSSEYPLFAGFMGLYGNHENQVVLDYGCGPGNDVTGYFVHSKAKRVIGMDVSRHALNLASHRLSLHSKFNLNRLTLIHLSDANPAIPLPDKSVDHINCGGVLQHTTHPESIVKEFNRVLKDNGTACLMVYNKDSLWMHLYVAYELLCLQKKYPGYTAEEAFSKFTDGEQCPLARCWNQSEFSAMCENAGFKVDYVGGYLSKNELRSLSTTYFAAIADGSLPTRHREFLRALTFDENGYPLYRGKHAGIGGVYKLSKASRA